MRKWYKEDYEFEINVVKFLGGKTKDENFCRTGEEIGDKYTCTFSTPVNQDGYGICPRCIDLLYPIMQDVRNGGKLDSIDENGNEYTDIVCPDGYIVFRLSYKKLN